MFFAKSIPAILLVLSGFTSLVHAAALPERGIVARNFEESLASRAENCGKLQGCSNCVKNSKCGFSKTAFTCEARSTNAGANQVTKNEGCPQMNQMQAVFPAVNGKTKAGIITAPVLTEFNRISHHIFFGESTSKTSGRHTSNAWLAANPGSKRIQQNGKTHISEFPNGKTGKTVWESADYSDLDIKNMCAVTIKLGDNAGLKEGAFVVQTPFGEPACIHHFSKGTGSCFPLGTAGPKQKLGQRCDTPGADNDD